MAAASCPTGAMIITRSPLCIRDAGEYSSRAASFTNRSRPLRAIGIEVAPDCIFALQWSFTICSSLPLKTGTPVSTAVVEPKQILHARQVINDIYIDDKVKDYIVDLVCATRDPESHKIDIKDFIQLGASPRATISLTLASKAYAFLKGRGYVTPQDVKSIGMDVLRHRVAITYEAEAEDKTSETVIQKIFDELPVP